MLYMFDWLFTVFFLLLVHVYSCVACRYVCASCMCLVPEQARNDPRGCQVSWNWSCSCEPPYGCWESNPGPLEEQSMLLTAEPSLQPAKMSYMCPYIHILHTHSHAHPCTPTHTHASQLHMHSHTGTWPPAHAHPWKPPNPRSSYPQAHTHKQ